MRLSRGLVFVAFACFAIAFSASGQESRVGQSWEKAIAYAPGSSSPQSLDRIKADKQFPVVLFMHGCDGLGERSSDSHAWGRFLAQQGVLVVMPDSTVRADRQQSCDPKNHRFGLYPQVHGLRLEEIQYATEQIRKQPWFDGKNLVLMGFSEGAIASVRTKSPGYRGVIAVSLTCTNMKNPSFDGVFLAPDIPVLTVAHEVDSVQSAEHLRGSCGDKIAGRANSQHVSVPGTGHPVFHSDTAKQAVAQFIKQVVEP